MIFSFLILSKGGDNLSPPLKLDFETKGGIQKVIFWNTVGTLRLIQSIPSKKAEPFKRWLAKVGYERIQEIENPELAQNRAKEYYEAKGYSKSWIEKRLRGIVIRQELTDEWKDRGIGQTQDFAILTNEILKATFDKTAGEYKDFKALNKKNKNQNLRDHMDDLELIFTMLGEASTTRLAKKEDAQGFKENKKVAKKGGAVAGVARKQLERDLGEPISTKKNYLHLTKKKRLTKKNKP